MSGIPVRIFLDYYDIYRFTGLYSQGNSAGDFDPFDKKLREKGIGVVGMKPFGTDWYVTPLIEAAKQLDKTGEISLPQAMLRYVINSELNPDIILGGMFNLDHVYENIVAFYKPEMSDKEKKLLNKLREVTEIASADWLPDYHRFLDKWAPDAPLDENVTNA